MSNHERGGPGLIPQRPSPDDALDRAWRDASDEQPPTQLDDTIVAAARRSVPNRRVEQAAPTTHVAPAPRVRAPSRFTRWQPLAVAASVAGLAFILVQTLPRETEFQTPGEAQKSMPIPESPPPTQPSVQIEPNAVPAPAARELDRQQQRAAAQDVAPSQRAVPAPPHEANVSTPVAEAAPSSEGAAAALSREVAAAAPASDGAAVATSRIGAAAAADTAAVAAPSRNSASNAMKRLEATDWAASIEAQYAAGDLAGAADSLRAFRAIDPRADQYLPDTLRAWARSVE